MTSPDSPAAASHERLIRGLAAVFSEDPLANDDPTMVLGRVVITGMSDDLAFVAGFCAAAGLALSVVDETDPMGKTLTVVASLLAVRWVEGQES